MPPDGFGPPLDLDDVIGAGQMDHYQRVMEGLPVRPRPRPQAPPQTPGEHELTLWGSGPDQASSCTELALSPEICWDVCGYYAALGVHWKASRRELMFAYHRLGGQRDERLTYIMKQLLSPVIRHQYDLTCPWELFLHDRDVWAAFQETAKRIARQRSAQEGTEVTARAVLDGLGVDTVAPGEEPDERDTPATLQKSLDWLEDWSWYTLGMNEPPEDASKLQEWQQMLVAAFAANGRTARFAVGFHPGRSWMILRVSDGGCIFLIGTEQPTPEEANEAVKGYDAQGEKGEEHMPVMTKGAEAAKAAAATRSGSRIDELRFDDETDYFARFLTDLPEVISMGTHRFIPTKAKPKSWKGDNWPSMMWFGCQNDQVFKLRDGDGAVVNPEAFEPGYGECDIHTRFEGQKGKYKPIAQVEHLTYALVVVQKPVDRGGVKGFVDATEEYTKADGGKVTVPVIRYVAKKYTNFYNPLVQSAYLDGTVCNKIYKIRRSGTDFSVTALGVTADVAPGTDAWKVYEAAVELMGIDLEAMLLEHASPEFFAKFLIPQADDDKEPEADGAGSEVADGNGQAGAAAAETAAVSEPDPGQIDEMRNKLLGGKPAESPAEDGDGPVSAPVSTPVAAG